MLKTKFAKLDKVGKPLQTTWWEISGDLAHKAGLCAQQATHVAAGQLGLDELADVYEELAGAFEARAKSIRNGDVTIVEEIKDESDNG